MGNKGFKSLNGSSDDTPVKNPNVYRNINCDPRSPSNDFNRTPLEFSPECQRTPTKATKQTKWDPRSPTTDFNRTPVVFEESPISKISDKTTAPHIASKRSKFPISLHRQMFMNVMNNKASNDEGELLSSSGIFINKDGSSFLNRSLSEKDLDKLAPSKAKDIDTSRSCDNLMEEKINQIVPDSVQDILKSVKTLSFMKPKGAMILNESPSVSPSPVAYNPTKNEDRRRTPLSNVNGNSPLRASATLNSTPTKTGKPFSLFTKSKKERKFVLLSNESAIGEKENMTAKCTRYTQI